MLGNIEPLDRDGRLAEWEDVKEGQEGQEGPGFQGRQIISRKSSISRPCKTVQVVSLYAAL